MKAYTKKLIAIILAITLVISASFVNAYAEDSINGSETTTNGEITTIPSDQESTTNPNLPIEPDTTIPGGSEGTLEGENTENQDPNADDYVPPENEDELNNSEQEIENQLNQTENELAGLSEGDQAYMTLLDKKIGYMNAQLMVYDNQVMVSRGNIATIQRDIDPLVAEITTLVAEYNEAKGEYDALNELFKATYERYCARLRAFYITGETSIISILLSSKDISQLLTRLQLISVMTKRDGDFMQKADEEMEVLLQKQNGLLAQKSVLDIKEQELLVKQNEQKLNQDNILAKQEKIAQNKMELAQLRAKYPSVNNSEEAVFYNSNEILNLTYPVPSQHYLSLGYGHYSDGRPHRALDFPLNIGAPVVAAQKGIVLKAVDLGNRSYGRYIMIYHGTDVMGRQIVTLYAHNSELLVTPGQSVEKGQQISKGGSTGNSTGPHCHFELRVDNKPVNPTYFLS